MSKQMTPCEKLGYKVGDKFTIIEKSYMFNVGDVAILQSDDGSSCPFFTNDKVKEVYPRGVACFLADIKPIAKLKPAKQALADEIHQNGGWLIAGDYSFVTSNHRGVVKFFHQKPRRDGVNWVEGSCSLVWIDLHQQLPNWHQCILSRDEYLTAYPEQVKVEVNNETEQKVGVEMKSESEITIKVVDWHKNGELPPVGEVCIFDPSGLTEYFDEKATKAIGKEVSIISHVKFKNGVGSVAVFMCDTDSVAIVRTANETCFRPLRTEREKAIDEMVGEFIDHYGDPKGGEYYIRIATKLYDAGYRKDVK